MPLLKYVGNVFRPDLAGLISCLTVRTVSLVMLLGTKTEHCDELKYVAINWGGSGNELRRIPVDARDKTKASSSFSREIFLTGAEESDKICDLFPAARYCQAVFAKLVTVGLCPYVNF